MLTDKKLYKMKIIKYTILISFIHFFIFGCDSIYTVNINEKAIVTKKGKAIGDPKEPGLHFKIPFIQNVHIVDVKKNRNLTLSISELNGMEFSFSWNISDIKKYYFEEKNIDIDKRLEIISSKILRETVNLYGMQTLIQIADLQKKDYKYMDNRLTNVLNLLRKNLKPYGIRVKNICFVSKV